MPIAHLSPKLAFFNPLGDDPSAATRVIEKLADVWRASVHESHDFLSSDDFSGIDHVVSYVYLPHTPVWIATLPNSDYMCGFMGLTEVDHDRIHIDTLFLHPRFTGMGLGRRFINHACTLAQKRTDHAVVSVDVNEQNINAVAFYHYMGFGVTGRDDKDADGRPYPVLQMARAAV